MLKTLHVRDFGIIEEVFLDLPPGLIALTGETGAGKSLIFDALSLLLGSRADGSCVRVGASAAVVEAVFEAGGRPDFRDANLPVEPEDGEIRLTRIVQSDGRSRALIQGRLATARELREIGGRLLTIAGQHAFMNLSSARERLAMLDGFANLEDRRAIYETRFRAWRNAVTALRAIRERESERAARRDYLEYVIRQIEEVAPKDGEIEALAAERDVLRQIERLRSLARSAMQHLYDGEHSAHEALAAAHRDLAEISRVDASVAETARRVEAARIEAREAARDLERILNADADPARLEAVEDRLQVLRSLARRHGGDIPGVLRALDSARRELAEMDRSDEEGDRLAATGGALEKEVRALAESLSAARREAASAMSSEVTLVLRDLGMQEASLEVVVTPVEPGETGADQVEFLVETNPGERKGPVSERASGGELSRIALALYSVLSARVGTPVMAFDEIDAGVSGAVAERMGQVLARLARARQVLVVTHHGAIAAQADAHFCVTKRTQDGRTVAEVALLDESARLQEVARMIGGLQVTRRTLAHAQEMMRGNARDSSARPRRGPEETPRDP